MDSRDASPGVFGTPTRLRRSKGSATDLADMDYMLCQMNAGPLRFASRIMCPWGRNKFLRLVVLTILLFCAVGMSINAKSLRRSTTASDAVTRALRRASGLAQKATPPAPGATKVTVLLDESTFVYPFSIFLGDTVQRFGSGKLYYEYEKYDVRLRDETQAYIGRQVQTPCIVASSKLVLGKTWRDTYAPNCSYMLTSDEFCKGWGRDGIEVRQYDGTNPHTKKLMLPSTYLPLGPRLDFWDAFSEAQQRPGFAITKSSARKTVFNAIFSLSTSESRAQLAELLHKTRETLFVNRTVLRMADQWSRELSQDHMGPPEYVNTVLDSVFTLSPIGHHPECYRMYEAIEGGSIPVVALDVEYRQHNCTDSLHLMRKSGAPFVFLSSWEAMPSVLEDLLSKPEELDRQQEALMTWYKEFMRTHVANFEKRLWLRTAGISTVNEVPASIDEIAQRHQRAQLPSQLPPPAIARPPASQ